VSGADREPLLDVDAAWSEALRPILERNYDPKAMTLDRASRKGKVEAMRSYRTQFAALEAGAQRRLTHPDLVRHEVVWVPPPS
jgi:hypothetical protein